MTPLLVSACLLGLNTRYNAETKTNAQVVALIEQADIMPIIVCPEQLAGFSTPRPSCEFIQGSGEQVWRGTGQLKNSLGDDVTAAFCRGAQETLTIARMTHCRIALLKERSPSCGSRFIHCQGELCPGQGVTTVLLHQEGLRLFSEEQLDELQEYLGN
ncbi:DUF523 domain-containing protein [Desulfuromonas acetoxidans]|uniref:Uncharacterized protein n=1 Tax=Desulfuromonas acetoxidans (strain DSM 684 / 11070) TaxID=281689 RepID=Q1JVN4_DESA6|nr:2-thiouracil desulfurase family protein [Desulfuromonas acetoxidans]EAT14315.1 protein of unknown function DUF523 [Desulfuromonas acetoxidans DSM 684]MBF0645063.1 DUF523 domain-containing protein [Desulfuromonas acetoxidans]NVD23128.1 DUF523 domain-containing protein [Desulfuromonas acetoxidans]NVE15631.1 DUF523 domain-containing protein [Desulfuromonas acetoxidans]